MVAVWGATTFPGTRLPCVQLGLDMSVEDNAPSSNFSTPVLIHSCLLTKSSFSCSLAISSRSLDLIRRRSSAHCFGSAHRFKVSALPCCSQRLASSSYQAARFGSTSNRPSSSVPVAIVFVWLIRGKRELIN